MKGSSYSGFTIPIVRRDSIATALYDLDPNRSVVPPARKSASWLVPGKMGNSLLNLSGFRSYIGNLVLCSDQIRIYDAFISLGFSGNNKRV